MYQNSDDLTPQRPKRFALGRKAKAARTSTGSPHPPPARLAHAIQRAAAGAFLRPWLDPIALGAIARWYLPLSRAWAAASIAEGSAERFFAELGDEAIRAPASKALMKAIAAVPDAEAAYHVAAGHWQDALFAASPAASRELARMERERLAAAQAFMMTRTGFLGMHVKQRLPAIRWDIADFATVEQRHGHRLESLATRFPLPDQPRVEQSAEIIDHGRSKSWIRFASPGIGTNDTAWARVLSPVSVKNPPTLIFLHGIGVEGEFVGGTDTRIDRLIHDGIRVIRPEGPWHGRRRLAGTYGSEPIFARGVLGLLELFEGWVREVSILIRWAREQGSGPVIVGGLSLGALTSQMVASAAATWPDDAKPDGMFLVATSGDVTDVALEGSLATELGLKTKLDASGWTRDRINPWRPLMEPFDQPGVDPEKIVLVLGSTDDVTPFDGGLSLARRWNIPQANMAVSRRGHFSLALAFAGDLAPLDRLKQVMGLQR